VMRRRLGCGHEKVRPVTTTEPQEAANCGTGTGFCERVVAAILGDCRLRSRLTRRQPLPSRAARLSRNARMVAPRGEPNSTASARAGRYAVAKEHTKGTHSSKRRSCAVGPYDIVGLIETGGMGEVYRARERKRHREIALKIPPSLSRHRPQQLATDQRPEMAFDRAPRRARAGLWPVQIGCCFRAILTAQLALDRYPDSRQPTENLTPSPCR
jgi:hypothetical protein